MENNISNFINHRQQMKSVFQVINNLQIQCCMCGVYLYDTTLCHEIRIMRNIYVCSIECNNDFKIEYPNV